MTPDDLRARLASIRIMSAAQLEGYRAHVEGVHPYGDTRRDWFDGELAAVVAREKAVRK